MSLRRTIKKVKTLTFFCSVTSSIRACVRSFVLSGGGGVGSGYGPDPSKANMMMLKIPNGQVGLVIGKQGATIRGIQDRTGVNIQIPQV